MSTAGLYILIKIIQRAVSTVGLALVALVVLVGPGWDFWPDLWFLYRPKLNRRPMNVLLKCSNTFLMIGECEDKPMIALLDVLAVQSLACSAHGKLLRSI